LADPALRVFCFPYAGGGGQVFRSWQSSFPPGVEVCPIQLPGRRLGGPQDVAFADVVELVDAAMPALLPLMDRRFVLYGHSYGALVAYELAAALQQRGGEQPEHLFVSGRRAPQLPSRTPDVPFLSQSELVQRVTARWGAIPEPVLREPELLERLLPILRADITANETYEHPARAPLSCPIDAYGGAQDSTVLPDELAAWRERTASSFEEHVLPGDHFFISSPAFVQALAQSLRVLSARSAR
jgi:medium-chain acyl-[acyl-carrier-protein] hydrolase